ncbi:DUF4031 domain-containing protein [Gulosibacter faecalis]|jgi:predicted metal-dependent HD superfamily phosphohydrolase|uniref:DUF4031 domain-containing protein n=1 Tax=Gulosibacter faecalis TaxID=272240 RepID=A0ABW5UYN8_9MICO|nr:DUF4031 domain-containing protein [Gulosibacter faecalis]
MTVLIDPARWPAHGTTWAHLVSDTSLTELHAFARSQGLARRRFDLDHYDVRVDEVSRLVAAGAEPVTGHELARRLEQSGLRIPQAKRTAARPEARLAELRVWWDELREAGRPAVDTRAWDDAGERLLARWAEPHRGYHSVEHLHEVLLHLDLLATCGEPLPREALLAAWFHDAVYDGRPGEDERRSADLARDELSALGELPAVTDAVHRLILSTDPGVPPDTVLEPGDAHAAAMLGDADLAILAAPTERYDEYVRGVRREYAHVADDAFVEARLAVLQELLDRRELFGTSAASKLWDQRARTNLATEIRLLTEKRPAGR